MIHRSKLRRQITWEAARLLHERRETEFYNARLRAARRLCRGWVPSTDLPSDQEIHEELQSLTALQSRWTAALASTRTEPEVEPDRFQVFARRLLQLENVKLNPKYHPEGDALYHSLQVFDLAREELPYDEEFLLAALLHDIGKAIDPWDHVAAGIEALRGVITERTAWFIEHHAEAQAVLDKTIGVRAARRLRESDSYDELILLARCDRRGRQQGVPVPDVHEALDYLRELAAANG